MNRSTLDSLLGQAMAIAGIYLHSVSLSPAGGIQIWWLVCLCVCSGDHGGVGGLRLYAFELYWREGTSSCSPSRRFPLSLYFLYWWRELHNFTLRDSWICEISPEGKSQEFILPNLRPNQSGLDQSVLLGTGSGGCDDNGSSWEHSENTIPASHPPKLESISSLEE